MRVIVASIFASVTLAACSGGGGGEPTSTAVTSATPELSAEEILRRSDYAMGRLTSLRVSGRGQPPDCEDPCPQGDVSESVFQIAGPQHPVVKVRCPNDPGIRFALYSHRAEGGLVTGRRPGATAARDIRLERVEDYRGHRVWVVSYKFNAAQSTPSQYLHQTEWISQDTYWLLHQEQEDADALWRWRFDFSDFDAPLDREACT